MSPSSPSSPSPAASRHVVVLAHPDPGSLNAAIAETYCRTVRECGQTAVLRDLYALHFDPVLRQDERPGREPYQPSPDVQAELEAIRDAAAFVLVYPIWFGTPPAILKGYVDRVLGAGVTAQEVQSGAWNPRLGGKRLLSFTTSAARGPWLMAQGQTLSLRMVFDDYLAHAFSMQPPEHAHFGAIARDTASRAIDEHLVSVEQAARRICGLVAEDASGWDA